MSKKLSTFQLPPGKRVSVVCPGLGMPKPDPAVMRSRSKSGSPGGSCPCNMNISVSNVWIGLPGERGPMCVSQFTCMLSVRW